ncbi:MAG: CPBP family glutamic-type intramembrane protease, partial [Bacilli bacterium]
PKVLPYLISALIFAFFHQINLFTNFNTHVLISYMQYLLLAIGLCLSYYYSNRKICVSILVHILLNGLSFTLIILNH